jgi:hypothetical protein
MRAKHSALILTAGFLLIPTMSWSQFPGFGGGGTPGGGRMQMDPDQIFNFVSKGQDVIRVDELDAFSRSMFDRFASRFGLTGNEITRDQFKGAMAKVQEMAASGQLSGMQFRMTPGGESPRGSESPGFPGGSGGGFVDRDRVIEEYFKRLDVNQDGILEYGELGLDRTTEALQDEREKYDTNHDGGIELSEFKAFMAARSNPQDGGRGGPGAPGSKEDERKRPTLIRAGNLPRDFPYAELDSDVDGQVGLYEWKSSGKRVAEFLPMDLNNDGFLTYDEYLLFRRQGEGTSGSQFGRGNRGGPGNGMMAMGDRGAGMPGFGDRGSGMPGFGDRGRGQGDRGSGMPGFGDRGSGMPGFGDRGSGTPGFGDRGSGMPGFGDRGRGQGDRGSGIPGFGDRGSGTPGFGDRGSGMPGFGDRGRGQGERGSGTPGFGDRGIPGTGAPGFTPPGGLPQGSGLTPPSGYGNRGYGQATPGSSDNGGGRRGNRGDGNSGGGPVPGGPKGKR